MTGEAGTGQETRGLKVAQGRRKVRDRVTEGSKAASRRAREVRDNERRWKQEGEKR